MLPQVAVVPVPPDPADYVGVLSHGLWFEAATLTDADRERSEQYRVEQRRQEVFKSAASVEEYLRSLEMRVRVQRIEEQDEARIVQLLAKTNQFNLTTRRHTFQDVKRILARPDSLGLAVWLEDRFGRYGLVSLVIAERDPESAEPTMRIDTWLMSCRAIGRTVEDHLLNCVASHARQLGYNNLIGEYIPTAKNELVADLYERFGFQPMGMSPGELHRFILALDQFVARRSFVQIPPQPS
jgi:FkbH-like protein